MNHVIFPGGYSATLAARRLTGLPHSSDCSQIPTPTTHCSQRDMYSLPHTPDGGAASAVPVAPVSSYSNNVEDVHPMIRSYPERISPVAPGGSFSRDVVGRCPIRVWGGPVEPATVVKVKAPLNGRVCGWACLGSYNPALVPEAPID